MWPPIHPGESRFVQGGVDYELGTPRDPDAGPDVPVVWVPVPGPRKYRAHVYQQMPAKVRYLVTDGVYSDIVTVP